MYLVKDLEKPQLRKPAINSLDLIQQCDAINIGDANKTWPACFGGLSQLEEQYQIKLKANVKLFELATPRRLAIHQWRFHIDPHSERSIDAGSD